MEKGEQKIPGSVNKDALGSAEDDQAMLEPQEAYVTKPVSIGAVVRNAAIFNFRKLKHTTMDLDSLLQTVQTLFDLLAERSVDYVLVGGIAMLRYVDGRNTEDIDLIVATNALQTIPEIEIQEQDAFFAAEPFTVFRSIFCSLKTVSSKQCKRVMRRCMIFWKARLPRQLWKGCCCSNSTLCRRSIAKPTSVT